MPPKKNHILPVAKKFQSTSSAQLSEASAQGIRPGAERSGLSAAGRRKRRRRKISAAAGKRRYETLPLGPAPVGPLGKVVNRIFRSPELGTFDFRYF